MISLGSVSSIACSISCGFPPAVEQGRDPARLQDRHVADDPGRAVAHGDADAVALARCRAPTSAVRERVRKCGRDRRRSAARRRRPPPRSSAFSAQKVRKKLGQRGREVGDDRPPCSSWPMTSRPPGPVTSASILVEPPVELVRHRWSRFLCLCACPPYEALIIQGEALASRRQLAVHRVPRSRPVAGRACTSGRSTCAGTASPISPASSSAIGTC